MAETNVIESTLYKGKVKVRFFPDSHIYMVDGKRKVGASTICGIKDKSMALVSWNQEETAKHLFSLLESGKKITEQDVVASVFASDRAKDKAAELGTKVHDWIERYIKHRLKEPGYERMPDMPEEGNVLIGATSFLEWEAEHKVKFIWSEKILYSLKHDFSGKGDFAAIVDGILCLCDIKTGNGMYNSVRAQTAAYAGADSEESGAKYLGRWAIRIAKESPEEYQARMALKNKIKKLLGKNENNIEPYQVFEAMYLDNDKKEMKRDYAAFLAHWEVMKWDKETDFWKIKNSKK